MGMLGYDLQGIVFHANFPAGIWKRAFKTAHSYAKEPRLTSGAQSGKIAAFLWSHAKLRHRKPGTRNQKNRASARVSSRIPSWASPTGREPAASRGAALLPRTAARQKRGMAASTEKQAHPAERCLSILRMFHRSHDHVYRHSGSRFKEIFSSRLLPAPVGCKDHEPSSVVQKDARRYFAKALLHSGVNGRQPLKTFSKRPSPSALGNGAASAVVSRTCGKSSDNVNYRVMQNSVYRHVLLVSKARHERASRLASEILVWLLRTGAFGVCYDAGLR